jgi:hypothetical protein
MLQRESIQKFHGDKAFAVVLTNLVDGANIGMVEGRGSAGFTAKTFQRLWVLRDIFGKKLERNKPTERSVFGLVDHTHPATAELLDDQVVRNGLTDQ